MKLVGNLVEGHLYRDRRPAVHFSEAAQLPGRKQLLRSPAHPTTTSHVVLRRRIARSGTGHSLIIPSATSRDINRSYFLVLPAGPRRQEQCEGQGEEPAQAGPERASRIQAKELEGYGSVCAM